MMRIRCLPLLAGIMLAVSIPVPAASAARRPLTLYIVRHAEKLNASDSSPLTPSGYRYARGLAIRLRSRGINRVLTCSFRRCKETAAPTVREIQRRRPNFKPALLPGDEVPAIAHAILKLRPHDVALIVGRSDYLPELIRALSGADISAERSHYYRIYQLVRTRHGRYPFTFHRGAVWTPAPRALRAAAR